MKVIFIALLFLFFGCLQQAQEKQVEQTSSTTIKQMEKVLTREEIMLKKLGFENEKLPNAKDIAANFKKLEEYSEPQRQRLKEMGFVSILAIDIELKNSRKLSAIIKEYENKQKAREMQQLLVKAYNSTIPNFRIAEESQIVTGEIYTDYFFISENYLVEMLMKKEEYEEGTVRNFAERLVSALPNLKK